jgi:hypothetical protein
MQDEKTIVIDINLTRGLVALLALALLMAAFVGYLAWGQREAVASGLQAPLAASTGMRQYYLTKTWHYGADADGTDGNGAGVCASGYHFASLWEIMDPSNLKYNTDLGRTMSDSGKGPVTNLYGWVRTGYYNSTSGSPGAANCNAWTSSSDSDWGTYARLPNDWTAGQDIHVWAVDTATCDSAVFLRVWCVADSVSTPVYLPIILKNSS